MCYIEYLKNDCCIVFKSESIIPAKVCEVLLGRLLILNPLSIASKLRALTIPSVIFQFNYSGYRATSTVFHLRCVGFWMRCWNVYPWLANSCQLTQKYIRVLWMFNKVPASLLRGTARISAFWTPIRATAIFLAWQKKVIKGFICWKGSYNGIIKRINDDLGMQNSGQWRFLL